MRKDKVVSEVLGEEVALTPSDLYNAEIKTNLFGGYSKNQVDALLERAADVLEMLVTRNKELKQQGEQQKAELEKLHDMEESLRSALVSSQKMGENLVDSARFQADALLAEAKLARAQAVFKMEQLPDALRAEIRRLMEARDLLRDDIAAVIKAHESLIQRIPPAEHPTDEYKEEEVKNHFVSFHDEEEEDTHSAVESTCDATNHDGAREPEMHIQETTDEDTTTEQEKVPGRDAEI